MKVEQLLSKLPPHLRRDGELILAHLLGRRVSSLPLLESDLPPETIDRFRELMERRIEGVPTAYLLGEWDFYGRKPPNDRCRSEPLRGFPYPRKRPSARSTGQDGGPCGGHVWTGRRQKVQLCGFKSSLCSRRKSGSISCPGVSLPSK